MDSGSKPIVTRRLRFAISGRRSTGTTSPRRLQWTRAAPTRSRSKRLTPINVWQNKHLNNIIDQGHRAVKRIIKSMVGFRDFRDMRIILSGIEIMHMIHKGQMRDDGIDVTAADRFYFLVA